MKKYLPILLLLLAVVCHGQAPLNINFQAVIRNNDGEILPSQALVLEIGLKSSAAAAGYLYRESHNIQSNTFGQVTVKIGQGTVLAGSFVSIDWSTGTISFEATASINGTNLVVGQQQLSSVPYALYATKAQSLSGPDDLDPANEIQSLSISNNSLSISGGNSINLAEYLDNTDAQTLTWNNNSLGISGGNSVNLSALLDNTDNQTLNLNGTDLNISNGNSIDLSPLITDADSENEIQHLSLSGSTLQLSQSASTINLGPYVGTNTDEQDLQLNGNTLSLSNDPGTIDLSPYLQNAQQVPFSNTTSGLAATTVQEALDEIVAEAAINLQEAYAGGAAIQLNGTNEFTLKNSTAQPILSTSNSLAGIGVGVNNPLHKIHAEGVTNLTTHASLDPLEALTGGTYEIGELHAYTEGVVGSHTNVGTLTVISGGGINLGTLAIGSGGSATQNVGSYGFATASISGTNIGFRGRALGGSATSTNYGMYASAEGLAVINMGLRGIANGAQDANIGVRGETSGTGNHNYGLVGLSAGTGTGTNYGVYGMASGATNNYAGYFQGNVAVSGALSNRTSVLSINDTVNISGPLVRGASLMLDIRNESVFSGSGSGASNSGSSYRNIAIGPNTLTNHTTAIDNVAVGAYSLPANLDGNSNVAVGSFSANHLTSSNENVAVGMSTLSTITSGSSNNVAVGHAAMGYTPSGQENVALGAYTMSSSNNAGAGNVAIGRSALNNLSGGSENIVIGRYAGGGIEADNSNILIGTYSNVVGDVQNTVAIGHQATVAQSDAIVLGNVGNANIKVGIGTNTPTEKLHVVGNALVSGIITTTSVTETSDKRLKENIKALDLNTVIEVLSAIDAYQYTWKADSASTSKRLQYGVIAQEVEKILPAIVHTDAKGFKSVNYTALIPFLLEAVKAQQTKIETLEATNNELSNTLKNDLDSLAAEVRSLRSEKQQSAQSQNTDRP